MGVGALTHMCSLICLAPGNPSYVQIGDDVLGKFLAAASKLGVKVLVRGFLPSDFQSLFFFLCCIQFIVTRVVMEPESETSMC